MVVETKIEPFLVWLLGPNWHQGAFYHWVPILASLIAGVIIICALVSAARHWPELTCRIAGWVLGIAAIVAVLAAVAVLIRWSLSVAWIGSWLGWSRPLLDPAAEFLTAIRDRLLGFLAELFGEGWHHGALFYAVLVVTGVAVAALALGWLVSAVRHGPRAAAAIAARLVAAGAAELAVVTLAALLVIPWAVGWALLFLLSMLRPVRLLRRYVPKLSEALAAALEATRSSFARIGTAAGDSIRRHAPQSLVNLCDRMVASSRRIRALTWLAVKESIRLRVVVVFAVFVLILAFAGLFLDPGSPQPARLYLSFVLTATSYLVLAAVLFLSSLSLPGDIKNKTLHTVVTKPVRPSEIVLGRILGFTMVGTVFLALMGAVSFVFVGRGLSHSHEIPRAELERVQKAAGRLLRNGQQTASLELETALEHNHRHHIPIDIIVRKSAEGRPRVELRKKRWGTDTQQGHWHEVTFDISTEASGDRTRKGLPEITYRMGPPQGRLIARVPIYGKLRFKDSTGRDTDKGVNVGDEWTYRSFVEGGTWATAIWTFEGITEDNFPKDQFPHGPPLEMTIEIFRTYKGQTEDPEDIPGIPGSLAVRNPKTGRKVEVTIFTAKDFTTQVQHIPRKLPAPKDETREDDKPQPEELDLFRDLAADGRLEVWLRCVPRAQYFGVAQADMYLRARDHSFALNFVKGHLGIWLQMVLVIGFGVTFSTFLSAPIALIATLGMLVGGFFSPFMADLGANQFMSEEMLAEYGREKVWGGGPVEAFIRLIRQDNVTSELDPGLRRTATEMVDAVLGYGLYTSAALLPDFGQFGFAKYVAYGFDISFGALMKNVLRALTFLGPLFVAGFLFLKTREVAL